MSLNYGSLKSAILKNNKDVKFEMYVIETKEDLNKFNSKFPEIKTYNVYNSMLNSINDGYVVLANDRHRLTGFPTWCIEGKDLEHPSSIMRVK